MTLSDEDIDLIFNYHNPVNVDPSRFVEIRSLANQLAKSILKNGGKDKDICKSINKLRECVFYAIASIVVPPLSSEQK